MNNSRLTPPQPAASDGKKDKFKLFSAINPALRAIRYNAGLVGLAVILSVILQVPQLLLNKTFFTPSVAANNPVFIPYWALLAYIPFIVFGVAVGIFMAMVLADGAHQETESARSYLHRAFRLLWRVLTTYLVAGLAILLPVICLSIIISAVIAVASLVDNQLLNIISIVLAFVGGIGTFVWAVATYIRFSLVGYVAMFEQSLPIMQTRKRSRQLLEGTGEWFVVKLGFLGVLVVLVLLTPITFLIFRTPELQTSIYVQAYNGFVLIPYSVIVNAMLIILFINRLRAKSGPEVIQPQKRNWKMITLIGLTATGSITLLILASTLIDNYRLRQQQNHAQQVTKQQQAIDDNLMVFTHKTGGYSIKIPTDFALFESNTSGDFFKSKEVNTPFTLYIALTPKGQAFEYVNDQTTNRVLNDSLVEFDKFLQDLIGSTNSTVVSGDIDIPGTKHKRGIFMSGQAYDQGGQSITVRAIIIPRNNGEGLLVSVTTLTESDKQLEPVIDLIFKSISFQ